MFNHRNVGLVCVLGMLAVAGSAGAAVLAGLNTSGSHAAFVTDFALSGGSTPQPGMMALMGAALAALGLLAGARGSRREVRTDA